MPDDQLFGNSNFQFLVSHQFSYLYLVTTNTSKNFEKENFRKNQLFGLWKNVYPTISRYEKSLVLRVFFTYFQVYGIKRICMISLLCIYENFMTNIFGQPGYCITHEMIQTKLAPCVFRGGGVLLWTPAAGAPLVAGGRIPDGGNLHPP